MRPTDPSNTARGPGRRSYRKRIFIACEGYRTEINYFNSLRDNDTHLGIDPMVKMVVLNRFSGMAGLSDPVRLIGLLSDYMTYLRDGRYTADFLAGSVLESANVGESEYESIREEIVNGLSGLECDECGVLSDTDEAISAARAVMSRYGYEKFDLQNDEVDYKPEVDEICVVVDRDRSDSRRRTRYSEFLNGCHKGKYHPFVTNPKFELWMLLHFEDIDGVIPRIATSKDPVGIIDSELKLRGAKRKDFDFSTLIFHIDEAMENAKSFTSNLDELDTRPGTNLPELVRMLRGRD